MFMNDLWEALSLTPVQALDVVLSSIGIYLAFLILIRFVGQRAIATMSSFDIAAVIALGAVVGRAILGYTPDLGAGILALLTLFVLQAAARRLKRTPLGTRLLTNRALLLMAGDRILTENLARAHISHDELWAALRRAGVRNTAEVACVVLESTGAVSVLRRGARLDTALFEHVSGADRLPAELTRE